MNKEEIEAVVKAILDKRSSKLDAEFVAGLVEKVKVAVAKLQDIEEELSKLEKK